MLTRAIPASSIQHGTIHVHDQHTGTSASTMSLLGKTVSSQRLPKFPLRSRRPSGRERHEILSQDMFHRILCLELKRAARSRRSFLLMLMDARRISGANRRERVLSGMWSALSFSTRETDLGGWYQQDAVLGVICTEISNADRNLAGTVMRAKVNAVHEELCAGQVDQIHFSFHFLPEEWEKSNIDRWTDAKLYPDFLERKDATKVSRLAKRALDIVGSLLALIFFSPLFIAISLAIKLSSRGPILFKQERVGHRGLRFTFLKFRSMKCANDPGIHREYVKRFIAGEIDSAQSGQNGNVAYKIVEDPRVTRVGRFLRKTSLDELPQFINVLRGEMSLVGPRPPIPYEMESYRPWHLRRVFEVKPGITGLWQVNGRSRTTFDEMVRLDLRYAKTWSLWLDVKILLQTPRAVLFGEGAY